ncbi:MAG: TonB-dependent receptor [Bacteroidales bacterium]|nr:TonB-dependent receptor [Bacteroidales bacterium]MDD4671738.1 TonB-dependent receptor [Bacteroidales bacterium]MDY0347484.1 TonB-dependent receptor [Tenuifilaceae bacterium]
MRQKLITLLAFFFIMPFALISQVLVKGTIVDESNEPLPGVTIVVQGTTRGTYSDLDGKYEIKAEPSETLVYSMIGMISQTHIVGERTTINITLSVDATSLEEVVVIGYGTQRAKDLTAPIVKVKGETLALQSTSNAMQAMQGKASGVQIINSGVPGRGPSVKIRGIGSIGDYANPLFVVDGVFVDNVDFLGSSDIEDLVVLKDASAAAIYGVRAANGVILITTKSGKSGEPIINYDTYFGFQTPVNIMALATKNQYVEALNEANASTAGYIPKDPNSYPTSTDWYKQLVRNAPMTNHSIDISGSTEKTSYSMGGSYLYQDGIMDAENQYQRLNLRIRVDQDVTDYLKIGFNNILSRHNQYSPNEGAFFDAFVNPPVYPVYDPNNTEAYPVKFGSPQTYGFGNQYGNPVAAAYYPEYFEKGNKIVFSTYAEFYPVKDKLTFKISYNQDLGHYTPRSFTPEYNVGGSQGVRRSNLEKISGSSNKQIIDNLLTYNNRKGNHNYSILLGQSTRIEKYETLGGSAQSVLGLDDQSKYLTTGSFRDRYAWDGGSRYHGLSFFARGTYNYNSKYLLTLTFRADGSSKYQKKWGYFPSIGVGWNLTQEDFMQSQTLFSFLKARASWGMLGNDNVPANSTVILGVTGPGSSGIFNDQLVDGIGAQTVLQNQLRWEVVSEFNLGFDFSSKSTKLSGDLDFYHRTTNNVVFYAPIATGGGVADLLANNGKVLNAGVELMLNWNDKISDNLSYHMGFNATSIFNRVLELEGREFIPGAYVRGNYTTRTAVGHPIGAFYGYEIEGVYNSEAEALQDPVSQTIKDKGFFKYKDQNGDNVIDDEDKVYLGSAIPWLITGFDVGLNYKNFDVALALYAQFGNKILNFKRMNRDIFSDGNYDKDFVENRWTDDNHSDTYPSAQAYNKAYTQQANDFFVEDGSFVRIQNIQIGYTLKTIKQIKMLRVYISAQRPYSFFGYNGFTPEIGGSPISAGVDNSVYPMQAIYSLGLKVNF